MRYGRSVEEGFLPVHSVYTERQARELLVLACQTNLNGEFIASELVQEQTLENLYAFGDRLRALDQKFGISKMENQNTLTPAKNSITIGQKYLDRQSRSFTRIGEIVEINVEKAKLRWNTGKTTWVKLIRLKSSDYKRIEG